MHAYEPNVRAPVWKDLTFSRWECFGLEEGLAEQAKEALLRVQRAQRLRHASTRA